MIISPSQWSPTSHSKKSVLVAGCERVPICAFPTKPLQYLELEIFTLAKTRVRVEDSATETRASLEALMLDDRFSLAAFLRVEW